MRSRYLSLAWLIVVTWSATIATLAQTSATPSVSTSSDVASPSGKHFPFLQYKLAVHCQHGLVRMKGEPSGMGWLADLNSDPKEASWLAATQRAVLSQLQSLRFFRVNDDLIAKALEGLNAAELGQRLTDKNNPMLWIAGHWAIVDTPSLALLCRNPAIVGNRHRSIDKNHRGLSRLDVEGPLQFGGVVGAVDTQIA